MTRSGQNSTRTPARRHARNHRLVQAEGLAGPPQIHAGRGEPDVLAVDHVQHFDEQGDAARAAGERPAPANVEAHCRWQAQFVPRVAEEVPGRPAAASSLTAGALLPPSRFPARLYSNR